MKREICEVLDETEHVLLFLLFIFSLGLFFEALFEGIILGQSLIAYTHTHRVQSCDFYLYVAL